MGALLGTLSKFVEIILQRIVNANDFILECFRYVDINMYLIMPYNIFKR